MTVDGGGLNWGYANRKRPGLTPEGGGKTGRSKMFPYPRQALFRHLEVVAGDPLAEVERGPLRQSKLYRASSRDPRQLKRSGTWFVSSLFDRAVESETAPTEREIQLTLSATGVLVRPIVVQLRQVR